MTSLLQTLLLRTLNPDTDLVLRAFVETVLPAIEQEFSMIPSVGGSEEAQYRLLTKRGKQFAAQRAKHYATFSDQSLLVHSLNALLTTWSLLPFLSSAFALSDAEKRILCLGLTLHGYNKWCHGEEEDPPLASEVTEILELCRTLGAKLNFDAFWADWYEYLTEIAYLAQNTQGKVGTNLPKTNWTTFKISDSCRLDLPLGGLLAFADVAVYLSEPADIVTKIEGAHLQEYLRFLGIRRKLVSHRLRDCTGLLTNGIHNAMMSFAKNFDWQPILFFAQGIVYLAPQDSDLPERSEVQEFLWKQITNRLAGSMLRGEVGFKRDGKGLKVAPQTLELFSSAQLIRNLPSIIESYVRNAKDPATPKRLEKLDLRQTEREFLARGADLRADRIAEFIFLAQKQFFGSCSEFISWVLEALGIQTAITPEQTQLQSGGVNWGWYHASAHYIASNATLDLKDISATLQKLAEQLATWAEENNLLPEHSSSTREVFYDYLTQNLEVQGWDNQEQAFQKELVGYVSAKTKVAKQPICSLSSGKFASEDQMDSVVLFKPQQYSNKNPLGGRQLKRGISKIWSLEMLLRQAAWSVPAGKLEEQQPVFLYIFPAYVYSPQVAAAIRLVVNDIKRVNFWEVRKHWLKNGMDARELRSFSWLEPDEVDEGSRLEPKYSGEDLPLIAIDYTTTKGKTAVSAWVEPTFRSLALPVLLGVKVVATSSFVPKYASDFKELVKLDEPTNFWHTLGLPTSLHLQDWIDGQVQTLAEVLDRLLVLYSVYLDDSRQDLAKTARDLKTDVLNVFFIADKLFRSKKRSPKDNEAAIYWQLARIWAKGDKAMEESLEFTEKLVREYRKFYKVHTEKSSHSILLPLTKALEIILSNPSEVKPQILILQGAGQIQKALDRQQVYKRPFLMDKSLDIATRRDKELEAIHTFMCICVNEVFLEVYKGDRALFQENCNRIKSGAEFAYRWLARQEKQSKAKSQESEESKS